MSKGFTIIELLIYSTIAGIILITFALCVWQIIEGNVKRQVLAEVEQNAAFAMEKIASAVRNASELIKPGKIGEVDSLLRLKMQDPAKNPTEFEVSGGKVTMTQGQDKNVPLTTDRVQVTDLKFTNLSTANAPAVLKIELTIEHLNPGERRECKASATLNSTVSLRIK